MKKYKVVAAYGTFDVYHIGHVNILRRAKEKGDYLIVGVSTDKFNAKKGKKALIPYAQRKKIIASCRYVDKVIPEYSWSQKKRDIKKYKIKIVVVGNDWRGSLEFKEIEKYCKVVYLPRTRNISSTTLRRLIHGEIHKKRA